MHWDLETIAHRSCVLSGVEDPARGLFRLLRDDGALYDAEFPHGIGAETLKRAFREMKRLRQLDARMVLLQRQGRIGFYGACTGQEATPIATALATRDSDWILPALRESSIMLARGFSLTQYLAQIFGVDGDTLKGRQMPSHMSGRSVNQVSWGSCIGTQIPQAVGVAWAAKLRGRDDIAVGFLGDGATSEPDFHNALNFAGVFKVPCLIVCQNNHWAISVPAAQQSAAATFALKGHAYGVPSLRVDGNDFAASYVAMRAAADHARQGLGPVFLEMVTYRIGAHSTSDDPTRYRDAEEVEAWMRRDPFQRLRQHLLQHKLLDAAEERILEAAINDEINQAIREVEAMGPPSRESLFEDVYAQLPWHLQEQQAELLRHPAAPKLD